MNELEHIRKRMEKRRNKKQPTLTDHHFMKIYNAMIKSMVALIVVVAICAYVKVSPNGEELKNFVLNDMHFNTVTTWINNQLLSFQKDEAIHVSSQVGYTHVKDNYYKSDTNEVLNFAKGRVIYVGKQEMLGQYVTVLLENNIEVTFGQLNDVFVGVYDQVDAATILGTYQDKLMIVFTQDKTEIDYETFEEYL